MINKAIIIGNLGRDPQGNTNGAKSWCRFSVATTEKWRNRDGEQFEDTQWHNVVAFGKLAEICLKYLGKGSKVYVEGKLQTDSYEKDGITRYKTEINAREVKLLSKRSESPRDSESNYEPPAQQGFGNDEIPF